MKKSDQLMLLAFGVLPVLFNGCAPALWVYETTSAISKAVYFEQLTETDTQVESVALDRRAYSVDLINILNS